MNISNILKISSLTVRIIVGLLFVLSAVSKLIAIDSFEVYIYSFNIFSYVTTTILSRLLIAIELFIGLCIVFRMFYKEIWWVALILLIFFTFFLVYVIRFRSDDNCHCFGDLIDLNPKQSLGKNIILTCLMLFVNKIDDYCYAKKVKKCLGLSFAAISIVIPFVVVPNDLIYNKIYSEKENINTVAFNRSLNDSTYIGYLKVLPEKLNDTIVYENENRLMNITDGRYIVNYVLAGCKYCKMGAERLAIMFDKHNISHEKLKFVVGGNAVPMSRFITLTETYDFDHWKISQPIMMSITFGRFPLYVFVENGEVVKVADFRHLDEGEIVDFLK